MALSIPIKLLLSLLLGSVIGLERESYQKGVRKDHNDGMGSLGIRSFSLITVLGTIAGLLEKDFHSLFLIISITFMTLLIAYYITGSILSKDNGITTELAILISFFIGIFIGMEIFSIQLIIAIVVVLVMIMSIKEKLQLIVAGIKQNELQAFISYAIIALVILPFLPNVSYTLADSPGLLNILSAYGISVDQISHIEIINPFTLWRVVVIISGVEVLGYILEKTIGQKKGLLLTSIAGGFISSTSTTQSLANQSLKSKNINQLTGAAIFANLSSFLQHFILIASVNTLFLTKNTFYLFIISVISLIIGYYFLRSKSSSTAEEAKETQVILKEDKIFSLKPALQFALIFLIVKVVSKSALSLFGEGAFLITILVASLTGMDAVTINLSQLAGNIITFQIAVFAFILANAVNLISKAAYAFLQGKQEFALKFTISILIIIGFGFLGIFPLL